MATTSNSGRPVRRNKRRWQNRTVTSTAGNIGSSASYIDLTVDVSSGDVIDLTSGHDLNVTNTLLEENGFDENILSWIADDWISRRNEMPYGIPAKRRRVMGSQARRPNNTRQINLDCFVHSTSLAGTALSLLDDSDSDSLPEVPFEFTPSSVPDKVSKQQPTEGVTISCPVCLEDTKQIRNSGRQMISTTCGHIFCDKCIKEAIKRQHICPTCRKRLTRRSIHPLFF